MFNRILLCVFFFFLLIFALGPGPALSQVKGVASNVPVLPVGSIVIALPGGDKRANQGSSGGGDGDGEGGRHGGGGGRNKTEVKRQRRLEREKHAVVLDEIAPKETGRQATAVSGRGIDWLAEWLTD